MEGQKIKATIIFGEELTGEFHAIPTELPVEFTVKKAASSGNLWLSSEGRIKVENDVALQGYGFHLSINQYRKKTGSTKTASLSGVTMKAEAAALLAIADDKAFAATLALMPAFKQYTNVPPIVARTILGKVVEA